MSDREYAIHNGPEKPALLWAIAYPKYEHVTFELDDGPITAQILEMKEYSDGFTFDLKGVVRSGPLAEHAFTGTFDIGSHTGSLTISG